MERPAVRNRCLQSGGLGKTALDYKIVHLEAEEEAARKAALPPDLSFLDGLRLLVFGNEATLLSIWVLNAGEGDSIVLRFPTNPGQLLTAMYLQARKSHQP